MKAEYNGKAVVEGLWPEEVSLNPPEVAVALAGVTKVRTARSWYVWGWLCALGWTVLAMLQADILWIKAVFVVGVLLSTGMFIQELFFRPLWRIDVLRRGKWQVARREQNRYRAEKLATEIRTAIQNGEAEYVFPQG